MIFCSRTDQIEQKLDGLVALLANADNTGGPPASKVGAQIQRYDDNDLMHTRHEGSSYSSPYSRDSHQGIAPAISHNLEDQYGGQSQRTTATPQTTSRTLAVPQHLLADELVSSEYANELLTLYQAMSAYFPFVIISPNTSVEQLKMRKPMTFLAILMTASAEDRRLQTLLEACFRRELANKTVINAHRSLDCLQSILVYLAW